MLVCVSTRWVEDPGDYSTMVQSRKTWDGSREVRDATVPELSHECTDWRRQTAEHSAEYSSIRAVFVDGTPGARLACGRSPDSLQDDFALSAHLA